MGESLSDAVSKLVVDDYFKWKYGEGLFSTGLVPMGQPQQGNEEMPPQRDIPEVAADPNLVLNPFVFQDGKVVENPDVFENAAIVESESESESELLPAFEEEHVAAAAAAADVGTNNQSSQHETMSAEQGNASNAASEVAGAGEETAPKHTSSCKTGVDFFEGAPVDSWKPPDSAPFNVKDQWNEEVKHMMQGISQ